MKEKTLSLLGRAAVLAMLGLCVCCCGNSPQEKNLPPPASLLRKIPSQRTRFTALLIVDAGCPCNYATAYHAVDKALTQEPLSCDLRIVLETPESGPELIKSGIPQERITSDETGQYLAYFKLERNMLPYFLIVSNTDVRCPVFACRVSPIGEEQKLLGRITSTLHSFPEGLR